MDAKVQNMEIYLKTNEEMPKKGTSDAQMTSSTISTVSSLASPVDSGVQMLDSESELTSVMSNVSGCENDTLSTLDTNLSIKTLEMKDTEPHSVKISKVQPQEETDIWAELRESCFDEQGAGIIELVAGNKEAPEKVAANSELAANNKNFIGDDAKLERIMHQFTESDFVNKNVVDEKVLSHSVSNYFDRFSDKANLTHPVHSESCKNLSDEVFEMEHPIKSNTEVDLMNISLNSYELLDYTLQNTILKDPGEPETTDMHVSMSEEVNENLKVILDGKEAPPPITEEIAVLESPESKPVEEQIVFRRQRKKKSKSDTPKKRVSFHEDILNSTKIDDIHINLGFITHEPDVSLSFFQRGFIRKPDVVKGRYSWAAEGDAPFYEKPASTNRDIKSDIYVHHPRGSSSSSSSTGSVSSSIDEEDSSDENLQKKEPGIQKQPKSSCLKKTKHKKIDTNIVQEEINLRKKKSETTLLDTNIFGSLKNILNFSTSVPLAERGVPEGQEDVAIYSSSQDLSSRRKSFGNFSFKNIETAEVTEVKPEPVSQVHLAKTNLKLTKSEGFYPNYPNQDIPSNIILCDSNVYEHKGISYSYEYDNFQKSFAKQNTPKSSTVYRNILKEFNFFRRKAKEEPEREVEEDFEIITDPTKTELKVEEVVELEGPLKPEPKSTSTPKSNLSKYASSTRLDWSDTETVSDLSEARNSCHLDSPKRKLRRSNHYTVHSPFKIPLSENLQDCIELESKSVPTTMRASSSKSSLINRFLRNVTLKKMLDLKAQANTKTIRNYIGLYPKGYKNVKPDCNLEVDAAIEKEVIMGNNKRLPFKSGDKILIGNLRKQIFRNLSEQFLKVFPVRSAYSTNGDTKPLLLILTNRALYVVSSKNNLFSSHFVLPYTDLNAILIGPSAQTLHFSNRDIDMQCILTTGCSKITADLIGQLEIAMRRDVNRPLLPAVKQLTMRDMVNLRKSICKQTAVDKDEEYFYYSIVNIQDLVADEAPTPMGPSKEGPLMFKTQECDTGRWETAYFILKAGVLYMLSSVSQRVPMRVFPLINGSCQGARRVYNSHRPHTFQLIVEGDTLLLAAPDEYVASEWLQELIHAASGIYNNYKEKNLTVSCSLLMTSEHILTVREAFPCSISSLLPVTKHEPIKGPQALSCAAISDLVTFRLPSAEQSWCILEFSCREVHEYSGDWIIYFSTNAELETFISTLEMLWQYGNEDGNSFPLSTIPETDPLSKKCVDIYRTLLDSWPLNTVHLQFL
ncbi:unnamed protein product [Ceutorhynchus assimilis]|uniref:PH domain-containing protein n=1 Tax=Ceutorhynchus assimilis TaxID=467358 RepID=A0A9N9QI20_9CUCU|nr:unnamed protein product [Ceutorhynchus assimilis]